MTVGAAETRAARRWQLASPLEWWYVHGEAAAAGEPSCPFMVALFRQTVQEQEPVQHGFAALVSELEPSTGVRAECRVTPELISWMQEILAQRGWPGLAASLGVSDASAAAAFVASGAVQSPGAGWARDGQALFWGNLRFRPRRAGFELRFATPGGGQVWRLVLAAPAPPLFVPLRIDESPDRRAMHYACWPRLTLQGRRGRTGVTGVAWVDHQWGGHGWIASQGEVGAPLGWNWLGAWLEDGSSWVVLERWDAATGARFERCAVMQSSGGQVRSTTEVVGEAVAWWVSPRTRIRHPVGLQFALPELDAELTFTAADDDQEIALPGPTRAVWQGAGTVLARVGRATLSGRARLELHGYGYVHDLAATVREWGGRVETAIAAALPRRLDRRTVAAWTGEEGRVTDTAALTATIAEPAWDLLDRPAKRWRPLLALGLLEALGVESRPYEDLVCPLAELTHTGSLVVDDIEDEAEQRRGAPAIHRRYGLPLALNLGNTLYFLPQLGIAHHPRVSDRQRLAIYEAVVRQLVRAHLGQAQDLHWSAQMSAEALAEWVTDGELEARILEMYALKTGAPAEAAAELACILAGANAEVTGVCRRFGRALGVAFQIVDDLQGVDGSASSSGGVELGEDLRQRKLTLLLARSLLALPAGETARLVAIISGEGHDHSAIAEGGELIRRSGAVASCRATALRLVEEPWDALANVLPAGDAVLRLLLLCRFLVDR